MPLTSGNAYRIFREQLGEQLNSAEKALSEVRTAPSVDDVSELRATFHTIRGGAGFLGFPDIANTAKQLEEYFKGASDSIVSQLDQIKTLLGKMEELAHDLPPATASTSDKADK